MDESADVKTILRRALEGDSFVLDREAYSLHDLTQVAVALKADASLTIKHAALMSPIERASIATVGKGRVIFS